MCGQRVLGSWELISGIISQDFPRGAAVCAAVDSITLSNMKACCPQGTFLAVPLLPPADL